MVREPWVGRRSKEIFFKKKKKEKKSCAGHFYHFKLHEITIIPILLRFNRKSFHNENIAITIRD
jgi:hypothetical protein